MGTVEFSVPGSDNSPAHTVSGYVEDSPEVREWLETQAIPRCQEWRENNPEMVWSGDVTDDAGIVVAPENLCQRLVPAPYCPSAYCIRCAGLRALDGEAALLPNEWMTK